MKIVISVLLIFLAFATLAKSESRYGGWPENDTKSQSEMLRELNDLIGEAEQARAAHPRFLRDLRALVRRHSNAWPVALIRDDFADGNFTTNPAWSVATGYFRVLRGGGLHIDSRYQAQNQEPQRKEDSRDAAVRLLGQLLLGGKGGQEQQPDHHGRQAQQTGGPGEFYLAHKISNGFSLSAEISGGGGDGFELGVYQGRDRTYGYRLLYTPKDGMLLLRLSSRGTSVVDRATPKVNLLDGTERTIVWQRRRNGAMTVKIDGRALFKTKDRGFRDPFDGFHLFSRGGALTLYALTIDGTR